MYHSIYDLKVFYNSPSGQMVRRILAGHINEWWSNVRDQKIAGIGYAQPYLENFIDKADRCYAVTPAGQGSYPWPENKKNLVVLAEESELPLETNSVDRILLIHSMEHAELLRSNLQEIWRVLKSNGRLLIVSPNRVGFWSRAEWSPFGQGAPYSITQLKAILRDNLFVYERHKPVLFVPPMRRAAVIKSANTFETIGPCVFPAFAGLYMIEASKQLYAGVEIPSGAQVKVRGRGNLIPNPVPQGGS